MNAHAADASRPRCRHPGLAARDEDRGLTPAAALVLAAAAMGTRFELVLAGDDACALRAAGEAALAEIEAADRALSAFRPDSLLNHVNREAARGWVRLDPEVFELLALCQRVFRASNGAFDPTVAPLLEAQGFDRGGGVLGRRGPERVGFDAVELEVGRQAVRFADRATRLELGAAGKGFALDRAAAALREAGTQNAFLHGGTSSVLALGAPPGLDGWRVAVGGGPGARVVTLRGRALSVSEPGAQSAPSRDGGAWHIVDPRSGAPARAGRAAVLAATAALAEAWSTALAVLGDAGALPADVEGWVDPAAV